MEIKARDDDTLNAAIEAMMLNVLTQNEPLVGCFWYDPNEDELFGIDSVYASEVNFYHSNLFGSDVKTGKKLHKTIWAKNKARGKDNRFIGDYTKMPRGRVFFDSDEHSIVYTGSWIVQFPWVKDYIKDEFQLPDDTIFRTDIHWNLGHGLSDEFL